MAFSPIVTVKVILTASQGRWRWAATTAHPIYKPKLENLWGVHRRVGGLNFSLILTPPSSIHDNHKSHPSVMHSIAPFSFFKSWWSFVVWLAMKKRAKCELKRNNSVVNDLDVGQGEEKGAESVPGDHAHQDTDKGPHRPWCSLTSEWHAEWLPWEQMCRILYMHILFWFPPPPLVLFFHGWGDLTNGVLTLNSAMDEGCPGSLLSLQPHRTL